MEHRLRDVEPEDIRELYVEVNGVKYPIKQAFQYVTGAPRSAFTSHDAMRIFRKLSLITGPEINTWSERYYTVIKSLNEFDKKEAPAKPLRLALLDRMFLAAYFRIRRQS